MAVAFTGSGGDWQDGRVVLGGVAPVPYRAKVVEDALKGKDIKATIRQAAAADPHRRSPDEPQRLQGRHRAGLIERTVLQALG